MEWKAFTGRERDGQRVELRWCSHGINKALHHGAPLFGVGASLEGCPSPKTEVGKKITSATAVGASSSSSAAARETLEQPVAGTNGSPEDGSDEELTKALAASLYTH